MKRSWLFLVGVLLTPSVFAHGISDADKQAMLDGGYGQYVGLGASHMVTGIDHLLFLFGVIFFLTRFKDIVKFITAFTLGHSITLICATFMEISANYFLVDAVIALTVVYKGFDNVGGFQKYLKMKSPNLIVMVFAFGLIHGFGLSTRLQTLPLGDEGLLMRIISFNVGVELGQIIALTAMLILLSVWRKRASFSQFSVVANVGLMIAGCLLFLAQMHGYSHGADAPADVQADWTHTVTVLIPPGGKEYKFHILKGESLTYTWKAKSGSVFYDFHGEPQGDTSGAFESFEKATKSQSSGSFTAPFEGSHGWYWGNKSAETNEIVLQTKGSYEILGVR